MNKRIIAGVVLIIIIAILLTINAQRLQYLVQSHTQLSSGIYGYVTESPTCPGAQRIGEICSKPYKTQLVIKTSDGTQQITQVSSDESGYFKIALPPGNYVIEGSSNLPLT